MVAPCLVTSCVATSSDSLQELMTSDSDGSFTGAASPRDLQSPVFHDKVEVSEGITSHSFLVYGSFSVKFIFQHYSLSFL